MAAPPSKKRKVDNENSLSSDDELPADEEPSDDEPSTASDSHDTYTTNDIVTLLIGENEHELLAFASSLTYESDFFAAALKKEWVEGQTRVIKLPEQRLRTVRQYLDFVSGRGLSTKDTRATILEEQSRRSCYDLARLYVFGEYISNKSLQNAALKEFLRLSIFWYMPSAGVRKLIYEGTPTHSPIRRLMVDIYIIYAVQSELKEEREHTHFLGDLIRALGTETACCHNSELDIKDYLI